MKGYFIYKDNVLFGNELGYSSEKSAYNDILSSNVYFEKCKEFDRITQTPIDMEIYDIYNDDTYIINYIRWKEKYWKPYFNEHFQIILKNYKIIFE